jgi:hypothetical protein
MPITFCVQEYLYSSIFMHMALYTYIPINQSGSATAFPRQRADTIITITIQLTGIVRDYRLRVYHNATFEMEYLLPLSLGIYKLTHNNGKPFCNLGVRKLICKLVNLMHEIEIRLYWTYISCCSFIALSYKITIAMLV